MRIAAAALLAVVTLTAQSLTFDVASVKASALAKANDKAALEESIGPSPTGVTMRSITLLSCIAWAYGMKQYQIAGPGWLATERYDIAAKTGGPVSIEQLRILLQTLLGERFQLAVHRTRRELPVYALVSGKGTPKLAPSQDESSPTFTVSEGTLVFHNYSLEEWSEWASAGKMFGLDRPIVDRTALAGKYDFRLKIADGIAGLKMSLYRGQQDPTVYNDALRALGLKLEPEKAPVETLVIDRAEKIPTGN